LTLIIATVKIFLHTVTRLAEQQQRRCNAVIVDDRPGALRFRQRGISSDC